MLIDLSVPLGPNPSEHLPLEIDYLGHAQGGSHLAELVGVDQNSLPDCLGWASERVSAITHTGTHVDAPFHYSPQCAGEPSRTIDQIPLDWFWGPGVCIPSSEGGAQHPILPDEVVKFEAAHDVHIGRGTIVLFRTGTTYGDPDFNEQGRAISRETIEMLCDRDVRVIGTDSWSIDPSLAVMRERLKQLGPESVWSSHYTGRQREFCVVEKLFNLGRLPVAGFRMICFPIKLRGASAAWTRPVAWIEEDS
jgi:kynurenine formamidase